MNEPKSKAREQAAANPAEGDAGGERHRRSESASRGAKVEQLSPAAADPAERLSPKWQGEFLTNLRLERARIPARFLGKTFDNFVAARNAKRGEVLQAARNFAQGFSPKTTNGLIISGPIGCGKTHVAVAILQAVIRKGYTGLYYNMPDLLSDIRATFSDDADITESDLLWEVNAPDLLVLDDLGAETAKDWVNDRLYLIVNRRYESSRPILVTTNLDLGELTHKVGERTVSRLCEMCATDFPPFPDVDYRKEHKR